MILTIFSVLVISVSPLIKCLFISFSDLNNWVVFFLSFMSSIYIYIYIYISIELCLYTHPYINMCVYVCVFYDYFNPTYTFSSVTQSCPTLCDPMNHSTPGLPAHHQLPEFTQTHVHWVGDAIQPSHPLLSPSPPDLNFSHHQGLFQWVSSSHEVAKLLEFQLQHQSFQWTPRTDLL